MPYSTKAMKKLEHRSLITAPNNLTYSYYLSPNFSQKLSKDVPTLMFVHGYPDDAYMWAGAIPTFLEMPYPFLVLDLLGFGHSSKPVETKNYNYKAMADSISQILDKEKVPNSVIPIGHDWGSATSQRFYLYHKSRCIGLSLLSLAYQVPSPTAFDLATANADTTKRFGYPQWEYWNFFTAPNAAELMRHNMERFFEVNHGNFPSPNKETDNSPKSGPLATKGDEPGRDIWMREMFDTGDGTVEGNAMYQYVTQTGAWKGRIVELKEYAKNDPSIFERFRERMSRDGFEGPVQYYHSLKNNTMLEDERALCEKEENKKIEVPLLYIGQTGDWVCRVDLMGDAVQQGLVGDLEERVVDAGHWCLYEKPEEIAANIKEWLERRFPVKK
ncbi:Epoxide hydrolase srdG [Fulvia fulva]|uniref:Epoxide hydrolase srdG n=1 Tax=Passalora fulva TaxID=5499 RepID=A0A9Q8PHX5_PASFU|nr:Epoxide hydrolase srdG [Fulvia fulva]KAK4615697.1 Epoxide hydrolase srdG [Fulvia fulva]KAK4617404.1 Epoxide hydrolase srdG [Fulvia fulva]UJO22964.1 Epoxide hydrolase srdG [Fulvia fulva]WPV18759.1 Epoxide hydrolase srdG [Fulvia fulva]WPV34068.1 Epoxide hydrolase srdG [Fulvia fulva]